MTSFVLPINEIVWYSCLKNVSVFHGYIKINVFHMGGNEGLI